MNAAQAIVEMLKAYEVRYVFGVPGDTSIALYEALRKAKGKITHVMARDERSASFMADVYARLSGKPGVCEAPSGGGALYLVPGLAEANGSSMPIIAITTDIPIAHEGRNVLTEMDQPGLCGSVTKWNAVLHRAAKAPELLRKAFRMATTGRPGAVQLTIPEDVLEEEVGDAFFHAEQACSRYPAYRVSPDSESINEAAHVLLQARRPVIIAGGGAKISAAWHQITTLAELLSIPVGTSINGKGAIDEAHPLSLGVIGGNGARPYANDIVSQADLALIVGCKTDSVTTLNWTLPKNDGSTKVIHIDIDPAEIGNTYNTAIGIVADAKLGLTALLRALEAKSERDPGDNNREPWADFAGLRRDWWRDQADKIESNARPIKPQRVVETIKRLLPRDSVIVADPGTATPFVSAMYPSPAGRYLAIPRAHGGLGYAIPGVVAAKLARPDAHVVGLTGDGGFGMSCSELETITRLRLPIVMVQFNNGTFGWIKELQHLHYDDRYYSVDFSPDTDHVAIAEAFGMQGVRIEDPSLIEPTLKDALSSDRSVFIDVVSADQVSETPPVQEWLDEEEKRKAVSE